MTARPNIVVHFPPEMKIELAVTMPERDMDGTMIYLRDQIAIAVGALNLKTYGALDPERKALAVLTEVLSEFQEEDPHDDPQG